MINIPYSAVLAAAKLPLSTLLIIGGLAALVIVWIGFTHWRAAVKVAFVALLLEGAIRKWVFPQGQELVYFLKDIILLGPYLKFFLSPDSDLRVWKLNLPVFGIGILVLMLVPYALNPNIGSMVMGIYGMKIYVFYLPLVFIMPYLFRTREELIRELTWYVMIAIPICLLGLAQWKAGAASALNVYSQQQEMGDAAVTGFGFGDKVRITGTFSYITGHTTFVIFFTTLLLILLSLKETPRKWVLIFICAPLLLANGMMSGSRAFMYVDAFVVLGFLLAHMSGKIGMTKNFLWILSIGLAVCLVGVTYFFYDAYAYISGRNAVASDGLRQRVVDHPLAALEVGLKEAGVGGYGIGTTHPATDAMRRALKIPPLKERAPYFDMESGQILVELGPTGFLTWYGLRLWLLLLVWSGFQRAPPGPIKTLALATVLLSLPHLIMGVVLNHTANMLLFGMTGLSLVTCLEPAVKRRVTRPTHGRISPRSQNGGEPS